MIVFPSRERLIEKVRRERRPIKMFARLEETDGKIFIILNDSPIEIERLDPNGTESARASEAQEAEARASTPPIRSRKSFVEFRGSGEFNRFISVLRQHIIDHVESDCIKSSLVKKHFYEMNPPYAPKDINVAFSHLVQLGFVTPVKPGKRNTLYRVDGSV